MESSFVKFIRYLKDHSKHPDARPWIEEVYNHIPHQQLAELRSIASHDLEKWNQIVEESGVIFNFEKNTVNHLMPFVSYQFQVYATLILNKERDRIIKEFLVPAEHKLRNSEAFEQKKKEYAAGVLQPLLPSRLTEKTKKKWIAKMAMSNLLDSNEDERFQFKKQLKIIFENLGLSRKEIEEVLEMEAPTNSFQWCAPVEITSDITENDLVDAAVLQVFKDIGEVFEKENIYCVKPHTKEEGNWRDGQLVGLKFGFGDESGGETFEQAFTYCTQNLPIEKASPPDYILNKKEILKKVWDESEKSFWEDESKRYEFMYSTNWKGQQDLARFKKETIIDFKYQLIESYKAKLPYTSKNKTLKTLGNYTTKLGQLLKLSPDEFQKAVNAKTFMVRHWERV